jgi:hypothetical protein
MHCKIRRFRPTKIPYSTEFFNGIGQHQPLERVLQNDEESPLMNAKNQKKTRRSGFSAIAAEVD